jgi:septal ring factor EnvC (AmiA/AmiB activator)
MKKPNALFCLVISVSLLVLLAGCTSKPLTTADIMRGHAVDAQDRVDFKNQIASDWEKGQTLVSSGEKRVQDGEKQVKSAESDLKKGQDEIARGRREIAEGQTLIQDSERQFRENFPGLDIHSGK